VRIVETSGNRVDPQPVALDRLILYLFWKNWQRYLRRLFPQAIPLECGGGDNPASCASTYLGNFSRIGCAQKTIHIPRILDPPSSSRATGNPPSDAITLPRNRSIGRSSEASLGKDAFGFFYLPSPPWARMRCRFAGISPR
jgi:hypothetical protein